MRAFVAVPVPEALRRQLVSESDRLADELPAARWVPATNLHLTLRFLGEVPASETGALVVALRRAVATTRAFEVTLGRRGAFPPRGRPRVLWIGIEPSAPLTGLQRGVATAVEEVLGLEAEARAFHPHLTLGRCRGGWRPADAERWRSEPSSSSGTVFTVTYVDLMESRLTPRGAKHRRLERLTLGS